MSRYEWEKGEFKLPSAEWAKFKSSIREAVNKNNAELYEASLKLHTAVSARLKGQRKPDIRGIAWEEMNKLRHFSDDEAYLIVDAVLETKWVGNTSQTRVRKPQKKNFPQHGNNVTYVGTVGCSISFDNEKRIATWSVEENNHAVERARETAVGRALFKALGKVKWARGTYGRIWGNDEYNRDSGREYAGGGGSYEKETFGPGQEKKTKVVSATDTFSSYYSRFKGW